jgi:YidC/Oxa1 family membrane protein insertase
MTAIWLTLISALQGAITFIAAATGGNIGLAIVTVSVALRVALLPFTLRLARRAEQQRAILAHIQPEIERLKRRLRDQPDRLASETLALYKRHGLKPFDLSSAGILFLQLPLVSALYGAISRGLGAGRRFLWIADLAKPDLILVAITGALTYWTNIAGASRDVTRTAAVISAALTIAIMWRVSAALGLYWASSTAVGVVQALWLRRKVTSQRERE